MSGVGITGQNQEVSSTRLPLGALGGNLLLASSTFWWLHHSESLPPSAITFPFSVLNLPVSLL